MRLGIRVGAALWVAALLTPLAVAGEWWLLAGLLFVGDVALRVWEHRGTFGG